jgi:hypothetical protein
MIALTDRHANLADFVPNYGSMGIEVVSQKDGDRYVSVIGTQWT